MAVAVAAALGGLAATAVEIAVAVTRAAAASAGEKAGVAHRCIALMLCQTDPAQIYLHRCGLSFCAPSCKLTWKPYYRHLSGQ